MNWSYFITMHKEMLLLSSLERLIGNGHALIL